MLEILIEGLLAAQEIVATLEHQASMDFDLDGSGTALFVDHRQADVACTIVSHGLDDCLSDFLRVVGRGASNAENVVVVGNFNARVDTEDNGRRVNSHITHVVKNWSEDLFTSKRAIEWRGLKVVFRQKLELWTGHPKNRDAREHKLVVIDARGYSRMERT